MRSYGHPTLRLSSDYIFAKTWEAIGMSTYSHVIDVGSKWTKISNWIEDIQNLSGRVFRVVGVRPDHNTYDAKYWALNENAAPNVEKVRGYLDSWAVKEAGNFAITANDCIWYPNVVEEALRAIKDKPDTKIYFSYPAYSHVEGVHTYPGGEGTYTIFKEGE